jgi:UDP-N-acetylglucosamine--N-acetylmuramyl-(pentapeptide) pyrophosphoryl-undecaprenol N-acetylglucosamine transferase
MYDEAGFPADVTPYLEDMPNHFEWADMIISRSGASTVAEITAAGRPAILIPFPHAADDHQTRNALALQDRGAALLVQQAGATGAELAEQLQKLARQPRRLADMATATRSLAQSESNSKIIELMNKAASV